MRQVLLSLARCYQKLEVMRETARTGAEALDVANAIREIENAGHMLIDIQIDKGCMGCCLNKSGTVIKG